MCVMWFDILQARIKAINTFFAKNGYRVVDSSVYTQPVQTQAQFASPLFMQPVYSPQQYSIYSIVPQTWSPNPAPYFETPLVSNSWWKWEELAQNNRNNLVYKSLRLVGFSAVECTGFLARSLHFMILHVMSCTWWSNSVREAACLAMGCHLFPEILVWNSIIQ